MVSRMVVLLIIGSRHEALGINKHSSILYIFIRSFFLASGLGPAYQGSMFVQMKEFPPSMVEVITSSSLTLTCSVAGNPTPTTAWYKDGQRLTGNKVPDLYIKVCFILLCS
jgi:hypothetical protein